MKIPSKLIKDDKSSSSMIKSSAIVYAVSIGTLVAYNIRWKYFLPTLLGRKSRKLPIKKVQGKGDVKSISVVLLHGMWHTAEYFQQLQHILAQEGYTSYAIDMLPGERLTPGGSEKELVQDLELTLKDIKDMYVLLGHSQGGLITQACLQRSDEIRKTVAGIVLLGSYPIGLTPPFSSLAKQKQNMIMDWGYLGVCFFGKLVNARYTKGIFLLPSTDDTSEEISRYIQGILKVSRNEWLLFFFRYKSLSLINLNFVVCRHLRMDGSQ
jgi:pimeloyl-ACP methyl ester carboxylesterase